MVVSNPAQSPGISAAAAIGAATDRDAGQDDLHALIARAKQEWECTVDALPELVCLLDSQFNVVRVNRTIECWSVGRVREAHGRSVHELLHAECDGHECPLATRLESALQDLRSQDAGEFELEDALLGRHLQVRLRRAAAGDVCAETRPVDPAVIVVSDVTQLHNTRAALQLIREQLEARIEERTRELNASRRELSLLSGQLINAQEDDRKRIAQELHDSIGQSLSAVKYSLERAIEMTDGMNTQFPRALVNTAIMRVQQTIDSTRSIAMNLRPSVLDDLGVVSALRWLCREFAETYGQIRIHTELALADDAVPAHLGTPLFRCAQEALNNVARHAEAANVFVSMRCSRGYVTLEVRDDGVGFDAARLGRSRHAGLGLRGLRERATRTGGRFVLRSKRRGGTVLRVGWPLQPAARSIASNMQMGFTLLELLVVMVIIGILAGFVAPRYFAQVGKSQVKAAAAQINSFDKALDQYRIDMGRYPATEEGLEALTNPPPNEPAWTGPYLKKAVPLDPWGRAYVFVSPGAHGDVDIMSYGKDGQPGGSGENADITSW